MGAITGGGGVVVSGEACKRHFIVAATRCTSVWKSDEKLLNFASFISPSKIILVE